MSFRWHWGHSIALTYSLFAASTVGFVVYAMEQRVDLVSTDYYEQSIALDAHRAAQTNARGLGDGFSIQQTDNGSHVTVHWPTTAPATGTLTLYRPADATADRRATIAPDAQGTQTVSLAGLAEGRWILKVEWTANQRAFYAERDVLVPAPAARANR